MAGKIGRTIEVQEKEEHIKIVFPGNTNINPYIRALARQFDWIHRIAIPFIGFENDRYYITLNVPKGEVEAFYKFLIDFCQRQKTPINEEGLQKKFP